MPLKRLLRRRDSIQRRLLWLIGGFGLGAVFISNLIWLPASIHEIRESQAELQRVAVRGVRDEIQLFLGGSAHSLESQTTLFQTPFIEGNQRGLNELAHAFLQRESAFEEIGIIDHLGREVLRHSRTPVINESDLREISASSLFQENIHPGIYWGRVALTEASEPCITLAFPLKPGDNVTNGAVFGVLNLRSLWNLTREFKLSHGGRVYLVDQAGRVIAADDPELVRKRLRFSDRPVLQQSLVPGEARLHPFVTGRYTNESGEDVMGTGLSLPQQRWSVFVEQAETALLIPIQRRLWFSIGTSLIGLIVCFGLAYFFSERLTVPIKRLREGVERAALGNFDQRVAIETDDEIGDLARRFNHMAEALNESYQGLEGKISDRTQEIASLYSALTPLAPADSIAQMLEKVIERLIDATGADAGLIRIRDHAKGTFVYTVQRGFPEYYLRVAAKVPPGSAVDQVFTAGEPLISSDIAADPRHRGKVQLKVGLVSSALLPLQIGKEVKGIIHLASRKRSHFNEDKRAHLMAIARQMGAALENRELFDSTKRLAQEQAVLNSIAMATSQSLHPDELLRISLERVLIFTGRERGYIRVKDPISGDLRLAAHQGISETYAEALIQHRTPGGKADTVFTSGEPLVINDVEGNLLREDSRRQGIRSVAWIPLKAKGDILGVLNVSTGEPIPFDTRDVELLQAIGNVIGVALENSQLLEETQRNMAALRSTNLELERSTKEQRALRRFLSDLLLLDVNELLEKMTKQAARLFQAEYVWLRLFDESGKIKTRAVAGDESIIRVMSKIPEGGNMSGRGRWMLDHRSALAVRDITEETNRSSRGVDAGLHGFLGAPLFSREQKPLGVIHVMTRAPRDFSQKDLDLIEQFANGAAIALENAQLFEQMILSQNELEKANRIKSHFLGMMSHELRTPLSVIIGNIAILKEKRVGDLNPGQDERLGIVERNAADLFRMLQGILDICRLEEGKMPVHFEEFTVDGLLSEIQSEFTGLSLTREVQLEITGNGMMRPMLSDRLKLKEILHNLVSNALKFTKQGQVEVKTQYDPHLDRIEFVVRDTGIGIGKQELQHIFDVFYQVDSSDQRRFGGAGLGLNIVRRLVELLQGEIRVESKPAEGSRFYVTVPRTISLSAQTFLPSYDSNPLQAH